MKYLVILLSLLFIAGIAYSQVVRRGNSFILKPSSKDTLVTDYTYQDSKNVTHKIVINKTNGKCWIWRESSKSGKLYRYYLSKEICKEICKELNITYKEK